MINMKYIAEDGKIFEKEEDCFAHENMIKKEQEKDAKLREEKDSRYNEVMEAFKHCHNLCDAYVKDYGSICLEDECSNVRFPLLDIIFSFLS